MNKYIIGTLVIGGLILVLFFVFGGGNGVGGRLVSTITNTSSSIGRATTAVWTSADNLQRIRMTNLGAGQVFCSAGSDAIFETGMHMKPTSTNYVNDFLDITDPNLLRKAGNCIAIDTTSTIAIMKFTN
ncbi:MAG TPA: hypothetical protein ENH82_05360 [bacterium]|nr:hypothetical protein [bacterium]